MENALQRLACLLITSLSALGLAGAANAQDGGPGAAIEYDTAPGAVVLRFVVAHGELATTSDSDTSRLEIHGDGRTVVNRPAMLRRAGRSEGRIEARELRALLRRLRARGLEHFDAQAMRETLRARRRALGRAAPLYNVSDPEFVRLEFYFGDGSGPVRARRVEWHGLRGDLGRHPEEVSLRRLDETFRELREMIDSMPAAGDEQ